jgi:hypothetical protein
MKSGLQSWKRKATMNLSRVIYCSLSERGSEWSSSTGSNACFASRSVPKQLGGIEPTEAK